MTLARRFERGWLYERIRLLIVGRAEVKSVLS